MAQRKTKKSPRKRSKKLQQVSDALRKKRQKAGRMGAAARWGHRKKTKKKKSEMSDSSLGPDYDKAIRTDSRRKKASQRKS